MQLSYQKPGTDHPMYGKVEYIVSDGMRPICYKTQNGYQPLEEGAAVPSASAAAESKVETRPLYVLSFKVNGEAEEMTFTSQKKLNKAQAEFEQKPFITDLAVKEYQTVV